MFIHHDKILIFLFTLYMPNGALKCAEILGQATSVFLTSMA